MAGRPGRGSPHLTLRVKRDLLADVLKAVRRANHYATTKGPPETVTLRSWVIKAMEDRLAHLERRRRQTARNTAARRESKSDLYGPAAACPKLVASADDTQEVAA